MKQCDRGLSPLAPPFAIGGSSSLSFAASESDPEDSFWGDFTFDFSFLTSNDQKSGLDDDDSLSNLSRHADSTTLPLKAEESIYGLAAYGLGSKRDFARPVKDQRFNLELSKGEKSDAFLESDFKCVDSKPGISHVTMVEEGRTQRFQPKGSLLGVTSRISVGKNIVVSNDDEAEGWLPCAKDKSACSGKVMVRKDKNGSNSSPLFVKMSKPSDQDEAEVDSPCWRGTQSHNTGASGTTKSLSFRRSSDDLTSLYRLNPLAPQFIPSSAKTNLNKNEKEFEENSSSSLKRSLSETFPPSSGEFSINNLSEAGIPQDSGQKNRIGILIHDVDESLGLISQDSVSETTTSILDISNQFQMPKKLDPLAPVFVPASAKLSVADQMIANSSTSEDMFLNNVEVDTHSSKVGHSFRNPYSNYVHESGRTYSFNPRRGSQVKISENTKLDGSRNKSHVSKKLNPLAPQFSLADTKQKVYGCENNQAANGLPSKVNSSVLFSPLGYKSPKELHSGFAQSSVHAEPSFNEVGQRHSFLTSSQMDVKKLLTTMHGLSELLTHHVHGSESSDSLNEQYLDLINSTVQNLNAYANSRVQEHGNYSSAVHNLCDLNSLPNMRKVSIKDHRIPKVENMSANLDARRKEKYSMVSGEIREDSHFEYGVTKENGFGKVVGSYQTEEQISPQVFFYKSLWLKAKADRSLMEYETFLLKTRA